MTITYLKDAKVAIVIIKLSKDIAHPMYETKLSALVSDEERRLCDTSRRIAKLVMWLHLQRNMPFFMPSFRHPFVDQSPFPPNDKKFVRNQI